MTLVRIAEDAGLQIYIFDFESLITIVCVIQFELLFIPSYLIILQQLTSVTDVCKMIRKTKQSGGKKK